MCNSIILYCTIIVDSCLTVREGKEPEDTRPHSIQFVPNIYMYQEKPFVYNSTSFVTMASSIQDCNLITPPDTPSPEAIHLSERFGEPRRYSSREHRQTTFFNPLDIDPSNGCNPRKRNIKLVSGGAVITTTRPRRMLKFEATEPPDETESDKTSTSNITVMCTSTEIVHGNCALFRQITQITK